MLLDFITLCLLQMEQFTTDRAHLLAVKDNEIRSLKEEVDRLMNENTEGGSSIAEMKKKIFQLEKDKSELLLLKVGAPPPPSL